MDIEKAVILAELETKYKVNSTYFVMVTSNLYNIFDKKSQQGLKKILSLGHNIGLHFDETQYQYDEQGLTEYVNYEKLVLERAIERKVKTISMHMPSKRTLEKNYEFSGLINSYSKRFFKEYKYLSDSNMFWREQVFDIVESKKYDKLHILTHPIWYDDKEIDKMNKVNRYLERKFFSLRQEVGNIVPDFEVKRYEI